MLIAERIKPLAMPEFNSIQAIIQSVKIGLGIALLPSTAVTREIDAGELAGLPWSNGPMETGVFMIWHKQKWLSPALSAFLDIAQK